MTASSSGQVRDGDSEAASKVSRLVVGTLTYFTGRGPESLSTRFAGDVVVVVARGVLTRPERMLADAGHGVMVGQLRRTLDELMAPALRQGVEEITDRAVASLLSSTQLDPDVSVHTFIFASDKDRG